LARPTTDLRPVDRVLRSLREIGARINGADALDFGRAIVANIGNPHSVLFVADAPALKLETVGQGIVSLSPASATRFSIFSEDADLRRLFVLGPAPRQRGLPHDARLAQRSCAVVAAPDEIARRPAARSARTEVLEDEHHARAN
jgi:hypothetical protein